MVTTRIQGMVQGLTYREEVSGHYLRPGEDIKGRGISVSWEKMSKSKYNGVDPEVIVQRYGADAVRLFMLFKVRGCIPYMTSDLRTGPPRVEHTVGGWCHTRSVSMVVKVMEDGTHTHRSCERRRGK